jgi:hypothetical protein
VSQTWILVDPDGEPYASAQPGTLGGHRRSRIYGRLDCPAALRAIARGGYVTHRVFFLTEEHARAAGYRPCGVCLPVAYASWKAQQGGVSGAEPVHAGRRLSRVDWTGRSRRSTVRRVSADDHRSEGGKT